MAILHATDVGRLWHHEVCCGTNPCPSQFASLGSTDTVITFDSSCSTTETDEYTVRKMHDRALMQLFPATLSSYAIACAIGSTSSRDLWTCL